ncbi:MAG: nitrate reductase associated protein [Ferruginibacter sp.]
MEPSPFKSVKNIEYFEFEEEFMEQGIRCIPMIVRFKLDKAGIKLKLHEWAKFSGDEKLRLALLECNEEDERKNYYHYVASLVQYYTNKPATGLAIEENPAWNNRIIVPAELLHKAMEFDRAITSGQWEALTTLQRFALIKLCRSGHENRNFPIALKEFGLVHE